MIAVWIALGAATAIGVVAFAIPYYVVKGLGVGLVERARPAGRMIGLTFDDGPDPLQTPVVLDVLEKHGVKATFFVIGEAVDAHPDLVRRIMLEGHELASHSYTHKNAVWGRWPLQGWFDTRRGIERLERLLGKPTRWFRAPFGQYSWSVLAAVRARGLVPVNWSIESRDWHPAFAPPDVVARVLAAAKPGAIIVMHDGGRGGKKTVHALDGVLEGLAAQGLRAVPLGALEHE